MELAGGRPPDADADAEGAVRFVAGVRPARAWPARSSPARGQQGARGHRVRHPVGVGAWGPYAVRGKVMKGTEKN